MNTSERTKKIPSELLHSTFSAVPFYSLSMKIRKNSLHLKAYLSSSELTARQSVICVQNQKPWDVLSSSALSETLQIIEADDRIFRDGASRNSSQEPKSSTEPAPITEKVVKHQRVLRRKRQEAGATCDDIYDYYMGFGPSWKKRRGAIQNCREAASGSNVGGKEDHDDDDEKPLKERSMKSILAAAIA